MLFVVISLKKKIKQLCYALIMKVPYEKLIVTVCSIPNKKLISNKCGWNMKHRDTLKDHNCNLSSRIIVCFCLCCNVYYILYVALKFYETN